MTDTKKRIIESAIRIFNEDLSAPLQKVADNAEVTRRTLHRYFKDRNELVAVCKQAIESSCKKAMITAIQSSNDALVQLERMLYAGIDCGAKYSVFYKQHQSKDHKHTHHNKNCADYDYIYNQFQRIIIELQKEGKVNPAMSPEWIQVLHSGIIESTINAREITTKSFEEIKNLAWTSYIKAIAP
ncbi:TetR/AcrR family transcriptional regulator [Mesonia maritima]|uniref:AcrR family transcriptional regulator n=1 Tax=Mesonia maritima TaxID=1793873 RepID=A0ABU1K6B6_9FLAO|nr:TetR/AcrR family transcriptional regulator [Mesonia maritima]MDR6300805.1 AcrR family transcriptional regulator [Mesonia maritima]